MEDRPCPRFERPRRETRSPIGYRSNGSGQDRERVESGRAEAGQDGIGSNPRRVGIVGARRGGSGPVGPAFSRSAPWHTYRQQPHATPLHSNSTPLDVDVDVDSSRVNSTLHSNHTRLRSVHGSALRSTRRTILLLASSTLALTLFLFLSLASFGCFIPFG